MSRRTRKYRRFQKCLSHQTYARLSGLPDELTNFERCERRVQRGKVAGAALGALLGGLLSALVLSSGPEEVVPPGLAVQLREAALKETEGSPRVIELAARVVQLDPVAVAESGLVAAAHACQVCWRAGPSDQRIAWVSAVQGAAKGLIRHEAEQALTIMQRQAGQGDSSDDERK